MPQHRVHKAALETMTGRLGPLDPLLDLVGISDGLRAQIDPLPPANTSLPEDVRAELLALNRTKMESGARAARKQEIVRAARKDQKRSNP